MTRGLWVAVLGSRAAGPPLMWLRALLVVVLLLGSYVPGAPLEAWGRGVGIGVSGTFYRFNYTIPAGSNISSPDIYIYVINQGSKILNISLQSVVRPETPFLRLVFSETNFTLKPGEHRVVYITIVAEEGAVPGSYEVYADVVAYHKEAGAVIPVPVGSLRATVNVVGASATVSVRVVDVTGKPVRAEVRLIRVSPRANYTVAYSKTGVIEAKVAPGTYVAAAYLAGRVLNKTVFTVGAGEHKVVILRVSTVYFSYFSVAPALSREGRIGFVQVAGVVNNLYAPLPNVTIVLQVSFNGKTLENVTIVSTPLLPKGRSEYRYNYVPSNYWSAGMYSFKLVLYSNGRLMAETQVREINVTSEMIGATGAPAKPGAPFALPPWAWILVVVVLLALIIVIVLLATRRRRRRGEGRSGREDAKE